MLLVRCLFRFLHPVGTRWSGSASSYKFPLTSALPRSLMFIPLPIEDPCFQGSLLVVCVWWDPSLLWVQSEHSRSAVARFPWRNPGDSPEVSLHRLRSVRSGRRPAPCLATWGCQEGCSRVLPCSALRSPFPVSSMTPPVHNW